MTRRLAGAFVLIALVAPAIALGSKGKTVAPTAAERAAILKAFGSRSKAESACLIARLAASNRNYATVRLHAVRACKRWAFNGVNVVKRTTDNHWKVLFEGSSYACPLRRIPRQVQRDLGICP